MAKALRLSNLLFGSAALVSALTACDQTTGNPPSDIPAYPPAVPTISPIGENSPRPSPTPSASPSPIAAVDHLSLIGPASLSAGQCGVFYLSARNPDNIAVPLPTTVTAVLKTGGAGHFYYDGGCAGKPIQEAVLTGGVINIPLSFKSTWTGAWDIEASDKAEVLAGTKRSLTISSGPAAALVIRGPAHIGSNVCSGPFTVAARDDFGNAAKLSAPLQVRFSHSTALLFSSPACDTGNIINSVTLQNQGDAQPFYVLQSPLGGLILRAAAGIARGEYQARVQAQCLHPTLSNQPSDLFQLSRTQKAEGRGIVVDSAGNVLVVGTSQKDFKKRATVRRFTDKWETVDTFQLQSGFESEGLGIARDPQGGLSITGGGATQHSAGSHQLFVRTSGAGPYAGNAGSWALSGAPWSYTEYATRPTVGTSIIYDAFGRPVIRGTSLENDGSINFLVRWGSPNFMNWGLGAGFPYRTPGADQDDPSALGGSSQNLVVDAYGSIWTTTAAAGADGSYRWFVLKSTNRGHSWVSMDGGADGFQHADGQHSLPRSIAMDSYGKIYVAGLAAEGPGMNRWHVRRSTDGGQTWESVDHYQARGASEASSITVDSFGGVYTTGRANLGDGYSLVIRYSSGGQSGTFSNFEPFQLSRGKNAVGRAVTHDSEGNVWITGSASSSEGEFWTTLKAGCN